MGLFDALKKNFTQGGVDVEIYTQPVISKSVPHAIVVRIIAKDAAAQIKGVSVALERNNPQPPMGGYGYNRRNTAMRSTIIAQAQSAEAFTLNMGEIRDVQLNLSVGDNNPDNIFEKMSSAFDKVGEFMNSGQYTYQLVATADVEGVALDPSSKVAVQLTDGGVMPPPIATAPPSLQPQTPPAAPQSQVPPVNPGQTTNLPPQQ